MCTSADGEQISTVLGSCVAVCLWDAAARVGGINHFLLPTATERAARSSRFGDVAIGELVQRMVAAGASSTRMVAKIFGGSRLVSPTDIHDRSAKEAGTAWELPDLGARNVEAALRILAELGVAVVAEDTGGTRGRKLVFETGTGIVWVKTL